MGTLEGHSLAHLHSNVKTIAESSQFLFLNVSHKYINSSLIPLSQSGHLQCPLPLPTTPAYLELLHGASQGHIPRDPLWFLLLSAFINPCASAIIPFRSHNNF